jgi:nitroreductase
MISKVVSDLRLKEETMNPVIQTIFERKSVRAYEKRDISPEIKTHILEATLRAPTAGNLMLYSIIEVTDQGKKSTLAKTCDDQPFIATAPWVLLFLADCQRWQDYFTICSVNEFATAQNLILRHPEEGDLLLACNDALIAAHTAVIAAESYGMGSCYIGDIMENCEAHQTLFDLPRYTFPICLLCFGYPTKQQLERKSTSRFAPEFIIFQDTYKRLNTVEFREMFREQHEYSFGDRADIDGATNIGQITYRRKFAADYAVEMNRSVRKMIKYWGKD